MGEREEGVFAESLQGAGESGILFTYAPRLQKAAKICAAEKRRVAASHGRAEEIRITGKRLKRVKKAGKERADIYDVKPGKKERRRGKEKGRRRGAWLLAACLLPGLLLAGCRGDSGSQPDAGAIFREAYAKAEDAAGSTSWYESRFSFSPSGAGALTDGLTDGSEHADGAASGETSGSQADGSREYSLRSDAVYRKAPFGLYTVSVSNAAGTPGTLESYAVEGDGEFLLYTASGEEWTKSSSKELDTSPKEQVELLKLLSQATSQSYLREEEYGGAMCHKLEMTFTGEALRNVVETVVSASGMDISGSGLSGLLVESLSNREDGDAVRGYCWIEKDTGLLAYLEIDAGEILQKTFSSIDGAENGVTIEECKITGGFTEVEGGTFPDLPEEAQSASSTEAVG